MQNATSASQNAIHRNAAGEPRLDELVDDPITALVMRSDGVEKDPFLVMLRETAGQLMQNAKRSEQTRYGKVSA